MATGRHHEFQKVFKTLRRLEGLPPDALRQKVDQHIIYISHELGISRRLVIALFRKTANVSSKTYIVRKTVAWTTDVTRIKQQISNRLVSSGHPWPFVANSKHSPLLIFADFLLLTFVLSFIFCLFYDFTLTDRWDCRSIFLALRYNKNVVRFTVRFSNFVDTAR